MTILLDIINGLNKFLGFLDISPKYSNRAYTLLSIIPTIYILRIVYGPIAYTKMVENIREVLK